MFSIVALKKKFPVYFCYSMPFFYRACFMRRAYQRALWHNISKVLRLLSYMISVCVCVCTHTQLLSCVRLFATPWTITCQAPLSMGIFRQEYWNWLPFPSLGDLSNPGIEPMSPALEGGLSHEGSPHIVSDQPFYVTYKICIKIL